MKTTIWICAAALGLALNAAAQDAVGRSNPVPTHAPGMDEPSIRPALENLDRRPRRGRHLPASVLAQRP